MKTKTNSLRLTRGSFLTAMALSVAGATGILQGCGGSDNINRLDRNRFAEFSMTNLVARSISWTDDIVCPILVNDYVITNRTSVPLTVVGSTSSGLAGVNFDKPIYTLNPQGTAGDSATVVVTLNCSELVAGSGFVRFIATNADGATFAEAIQLSVSDERTNVTALPASITATHTIGTSPCPQTLGTFVVKNEGGTSLSVSIPAVTDLTMSPASFTLATGASQTVTVQFTCDDVPPLTKTITVNATAGSKTVTKNVSVQLNKG